MVDAITPWPMLAEVQCGPTVVRLEGGRVALDEEAALRFREGLLLLVREGRHLAVDLGNVHFLSSTTVETLLTVHRRLRAAGGRLSVFNLTPSVAEIFDVLNLAAILDVRTGPGDRQP
jgi:anti-anti-sigma factor